MTFHLMMKIFPDIPNLQNEPVFTITDVGSTPIPVQKGEFESIIGTIETLENIRFQEIELVYVDENEIVRINREHLDRDYVTDIITFRYDEGKEDAIEGTLFCCSDRIKEQSQELEVDESHEYLRIFIHGLLHLAGYDDQTSGQKEIMTQKENEILELTNR